MSDLREAARKIGGRKLIDMTGSRIGRLVVSGMSGIDKHGQAVWDCVCTCGKRKTFRGGDLRSGAIKSCGCYGSEVRRASATTQGGLGRTPTAEIWRSMLSRCNKPTDHSYPRYGGRGIKVCARWLDFQQFLADMGHRPDGMSIERKDNDGDYSPDNCLWATRSMQARNKRNTLRWNGRPLADIADESGKNYETLFYRLKKYGTPFPPHLEQR